MLLRSAMAKNGFQPERPCERRIRYTHNTGSRIIAASATRSKTTVSGGNSFSTTPLKKNDPPHSTESNASSDQSRGSIRSSLGGIFCGSHTMKQTLNVGPALFPPDFRTQVRDGPISA